MGEFQAQWYWDRRTNKAYYPVEQADGTVTFVTVWHEEEAADATEAGALVPIDEISGDRRNAFDLKESFRLPEDPASLLGEQ